jgi:hypothetical protein
MDESGGTFRSRLIRATRNSASLRTTVPQVVAELLELRSGDSIIWSIDATGTLAWISRAPSPTRTPGHGSQDPSATGPNELDLSWQYVKAPVARPAE